MHKEFGGPLHHPHDLNESGENIICLSFVMTLKPLVMNTTGDATVKQRKKFGFSSDATSCFCFCIRRCIVEQKLAGVVSKMKFTAVCRSVDDLMKLLKATVDDQENLHVTLFQACSMMYFVLIDARCWVYWFGTESISDIRWRWMTVDSSLTITTNNGNKINKMWKFLSLVE